ERERERDAAVVIADSEQPVLAPAVGAAARVVVREVVPAVAVAGVVLAHGRPLAFGEIRAPALPVARARAVLRETEGLGAGVVVPVPVRIGRSHGRVPSSTDSARSRSTCPSGSEAVSARSKPSSAFGSETRPGDINAPGDASSCRSRAAGSRTRIC